MINVEDTTVDKGEWLKITTCNGTTSSPCDLGGVDYLSDVIECYMTGPVGIHNGKAITAQVMTFPDIKEARRSILEDGFVIALYSLIYQPGKPVYQKRGQQVLASSPTISPGHWRLRYAKVEKTPTKVVTFPVEPSGGLVQLRFKQDQEGSWICKMSPEMMYDLQKGYEIPPDSRLEVSDVR